MTRHPVSSRAFVLRITVSDRVDASSYNSSEYYSRRSERNGGTGMQTACLHPCDNSFFFSPFFFSFSFFFFSFKEENVSLHLRRDKRIGVTKPQHIPDMADIYFHRLHFAVEKLTEECCFGARAGSKILFQGSFERCVEFTHFFFSPLHVERSLLLFCNFRRDVASHVLSYTHV